MKNINGKNGEGLKTYTSKSVILKLVFPFAALLCSPSVGSASTILGTASDFAVLAYSTVTNTGPTYINGNVGISPGTSYTGSQWVTQTGSQQLANSTSLQARNDATAAYTYLAGRTPTTNLTGADLGTLGYAMTPGNYAFSSSVGLTGTLTLDAQNLPNALFVFQIGSTLTTASASVVNIINGNAGTGVFWQVGSSATLGTGSNFAGNIIALASITLTTNVNILCGRAIALNGAVTMDTNKVSNSCSTGGGNYGTGRSDFGSNAFSGDAMAAIPEPGTVGLLFSGLGLVALGSLRRRFKKA